MSLGADVVAAGAVVTRRGGSEVLLVHRPKYDDWSFPKGKRDLPEHVATTAVREVYEETGLRIQLGRPLPAQRYEVRTGRSKVVHYWVGRCHPDAPQAHQHEFSPNTEVDQIAWLSIHEAMARLSYVDDGDTLESFATFPKKTSALMVIRHATALKRAAWTGSHSTDSDRPLTPSGLMEAHCLSPLLAAFGISDLHSSTSTRCRQTLHPYAEAYDLAIADHAALSEEGVDPAAIAHLLATLLASKKGTALCSHRPVLPVIFESLAASHEPVEPLAPAEVAVFHRRAGRIHSTERHQVA